MTSILFIVLSATLDRWNILNFISSLIWSISLDKVSGASLGLMGFLLVVYKSYQKARMYKAEADAASELRREAKARADKAVEDLKQEKLETEALKKKNDGSQM